MHTATQPAVRHQQLATSVWIDIPGGAGAGDGGTIIALHPDPAEMIAALREAGSERIFRPRPVPGACLDEPTSEQE